MSGTPSEEQLEKWRDELRRYFFEQMIVQNAFSLLLTSGRGVSVDEAEQAILEGLDTSLAAADKTFGDLLKEPSLTALYTEEIKRVLDEIKERVSEYAKMIRRKGF